ncbi:MAG TPA: TIGR03557 family F420-dependent LLM class oxidoreductase [Actinomycetota bacterium]|nr:TIGR03557 family F420-dependent LLM class oxidoreductase [Actinomycetota bacterium]
MEIGYSLSSEEQRPNDLVDLAAEAEQRGFAFALISDHYHPWTRRQGQSPFVWSVIGGIARATSTLRLGTGVTCPTIRIHPAIIAQAAATSACLMEGRFFLGVGSGENLNEHILGDRWPEASVRLEMLEEAVGVIRLLWEGGSQSHRGRYYTVENACIFSLPDEPPAICVAAAGERAAELAGKIGDGLVGVAPGPVVKTFEQAGGKGKPKYGQVTVCYAKTESEAQATARSWWPNAAVEGELGQELPLPAHFEQATSWVDDKTMGEKIPCGPDPEIHVNAIKEYAGAGYTHVYVHQVGPDQAAFFDFYEREVMPALSTVTADR